MAEDHSNRDHAIELAGLGTLAAPIPAMFAKDTAEHLAKHRLPGQVASGVERLAHRAANSSLGRALTHPVGEHGMELAGLGMLAAPSLAHFANKMRSNEPAQPKLAHAIPMEMLQAFSNELQKEAYGEKEHTELAQMSLDAMGAKSQHMRDAVTKGAIQVDKGVRHPWLPHTDPMHSFPGSQSRLTIGDNVVAKQNAAAHDMAHAIANPHDALSQARSYRGFKNLGEGTHQLADITAHVDKPRQAGLGSRTLRKHFPQTGYGAGYLISGPEHIESGLPGSTYVDTLGNTAADDVARRRATGFGNATRKKVVKRLTDVHGVTPEAAEKAVADHFANAHGGTSARVLGEGSRDLRYLKSEAGRAISTAAAAPRGAFSRMAGAGSYLLNKARSMAGTPAIAQAPRLITSATTPIGSGGLLSAGARRLAPVLQRI